MGWSLVDDFVVGVEGEGGGESSDVGDERGVLKRWRRGRHKCQLAHFTVGRGRGSRIWAAGGALITFLHAEADHLSADRNRKENKECDFNNSTLLKQLVSYKRSSERNTASCLLTCTLSFLLLLFLCSRNQETSSCWVNVFRTSICNANHSRSSSGTRTSNTASQHQIPGPISQ